MLVTVTVGVVESQAITASTDCKDCGLYKKDKDSCLEIQMLFFNCWNSIPGVMHGLVNRW